MKQNSYISISDCAKLLSVKRSIIESIVRTGKVRVLKCVERWDGLHPYIGGGAAFKRYVFPAEILSFIPQQQARIESIRTRFVVSKRIGRGPWKVLDRSEFPKGIKGNSGTCCLIKLERKLNKGMLWEEADVAYPRMGMHDHAIYKVTQIYKKP